MFISKVSRKNKNIKLKIVKSRLKIWIKTFFGNVHSNFNANTLILIPNYKSIETIDHYTPISIEIFKFKIISKILAGSLSSIFPNIISKEERGIINGVCIKNCTFLASQDANMMHIKIFYGNISLKIDITEDFDTIEQPFLIKVLQLLASMKFSVIGLKPFFA